MDCGVLIIPTFRTVADKPEICSDILMALHEANIRIISPYDEFDSKEIYDQATAETAELFNDLRKALRQAISKCVVKNVDEFIGYVELTKTHHKNSPFVLAYGNKAIQIPYSDDICEEIFDFLDIGNYQTCDAFAFIRAISLYAEEKIKNTYMTETLDKNCKLTVCQYGCREKHSLKGEWFSYTAEIEYTADNASYCESQPQNWY